MIHTRKKTGFTLIELMVVIVIIGILATLGLLTFRNALAKSRDSKRTGDMKDLSTTLEQLKAVDGSYTADAAGATCNFGGMVGDLEEPTDPGDLAYTCYTSTTEFCLSAELEGANNGNCTGCTNSSTFATAAGANGHFCVKSKQ